MADLIEINIATLKNDITDMQTELQGLRDEMKLAFESVTELDAMWNGPANDAFNRAFQDDNKSMEKMCTIIQSLIDFMENARTEYTNCEAAISAEIDALRI